MPKFHDRSTGTVHDLPPKEGRMDHFNLTGFSPRREVRPTQDRYSVVETDSGHAIYDRQEGKHIPNKDPQPRKPSTMVDHDGDRAYSIFRGNLDQAARKMNAGEGGQMPNPDYVGKTDKPKGRRQNPNLS
jgi:hypothetical protein